MPINKTIVNATDIATVFYTEVAIQGWIDKIEIVTDASTGDDKTLILSKATSGEEILHLESGIDSESEYGYRPRITALQDNVGDPIADAHEKHYVDGELLQIEIELDGGTCDIAITWIPD